MISLIRKCPRYLNISTGFLAAGNQVTRRKSPLYTTNNKHLPPSKTQSVKSFAYFNKTLRKLSTQDKRYPDFNETFEDILSELSEILSDCKLNETSAWLNTVMEYNLRNSEKNIVLLTVLAYENLAKSENLTSENMRLAHILGWCIEMLNTAGLMLDDIMDNSTTRRGQPCWHTLTNVGINGINDALLINVAIYTLLEKNFKHLDCYLRLMELFLEASLKNVCGQTLDISRATAHVSTFNMKSYNSMAVNKATHDNFYLPFAVAAQLAGFKDERALRQCQAIIFEIGLFFQIQNDFMDCFGNLETAGKVGTDIQDHKYSWLAVACMERATDEQKQIMIECYGKNDPEMVKRVKELYLNLDLPGIYAAYGEEFYNNTTALITQTSKGVPQEIFLQILNKICRRSS